MVLKTEVCRFSGLKIYPGHGMRLTKTDSQTYLFLNAKCKRLFNLRLRPAKLAWTTQYRKAHKKVRSCRVMMPCRGRCALSRVVDVAYCLDARRRTARPLGKEPSQTRFRVFQVTRFGPGSGVSREPSRRTPRLPAATTRSETRARARASISSRCNARRPARPSGASAENRRARHACSLRGGARRAILSPSSRRASRRADERERTAVDSPSIPHHATTQDQTTEIARKKKRSVKTNNRSIVGASLEVIQKKRAEKSDVRAAARDAALREIKERQRKAKDAKKGKK